MIAYLMDTFTMIRSQLERMKESDFRDSFAVEIDGELGFDNYVAKNIWASDRRILNGNRYSFIEPLGSNSIWYS